MVASTASSGSSSARLIGPPMARAFDWPLSRSEKITSAFRLYEQDVQAASLLLEAKEHEVRKLRRRSDQAFAQVARLSISARSQPATNAEAQQNTASELPAAAAPDEVAAISSHPSQDPKAPKTQRELHRVATPSRSTGLKPSAEAEAQATAAVLAEDSLFSAEDREAQEIEAATRPMADEEYLQKALRHYYQNRRLGNQGAAAAEAKAWELARQHTGEARAAELWSQIGVDDELPLAAVVLWLARSLGQQGPTLTEPRSVRWRRALMPTSRAMPAAGDTATERKAGYAAAVSRACKAPRAAEIRAEAAQEAKTHWRSEAFLAAPGVADAVASICLAASLERSRHVRGTAQVATLLLFALASKEGSEASPSDEVLASAEVDAFWCLSRLLSEDRGILLDDCHEGGGSASAAAAASTKVMERRCQDLVEVYDPCLAKLLCQQGLTALPALRLGAAYCTRAGFSLSACAQLWDSCLADAKRFDLCDYIVSGLLVAIRTKLMEKKSDASAMAEVLLSAPKTISLDTLLRTARAMRALERRRLRLATADGSEVRNSRSHRARSVPPVQGQTRETIAQTPAPAVMDGILRAWGNARAAIAEVVKDTVQSARNSVRCLPKGALLKGEKQDAVHEEEMLPLQRRDRDEVPFAASAVVAPVDELFALPAGPRPQQRHTSTPSQLLMTQKSGSRLLDI